MANASQKITEFPGMADLPDPVAALPADFLSQGRDPTREIRNLIDSLQAATRDSRRRQRQAEEECEQLRSQVLDLEERLESSPKDGGQMKSLIRERDMLVEQQSQYGPTISDLKQRLKRAESEVREANDERDAAVREKKNLNRQIEDSEKQRAEAFRQRESANRQRDLIKGERDEALEKATLHKKNFTDAQKAIAEAQKALAETRQELAAARKKGGSELGTQLDSLRQARDGMSAQVTELKQRVSDPATFLQDLQRVADGGTALDPDVVDLMVRRADTVSDSLDRLTGRQRDVLALIAEGQSNAAIAYRLCIGEKAVVMHTSNIYRELDLSHDDLHHRRVLAVLRYLNT